LFYSQPFNLILSCLKSIYCI